MFESDPHILSESFSPLKIPPRTFSSSFSSLSFLTFFPKKRSPKKKNKKEERNSERCRRPSLPVPSRRRGRALGATGGWGAPPRVGQMPRVSVHGYLTTRSPARHVSRAGPPALQFPTRRSSRRTETKRKWRVGPTRLSL